MKRERVFKLVCLLALAFFFSSASYAAKTNIAVMPFENSTGSDELKWIGVGMAETISTNLHRSLGGCNVVERSQLIKIFDEIKLQLSGAVDVNSAVEAGNILGASYIVIGGYQKAGDLLRITTRLVGVEKSDVIIAVTKDCKIEDIFSVQDSMSREIIAKIDANADLSGNEPTISRENISDYEELNKAIVALYEKNEKKANAILSSLVDRRPDYGDAVDLYSETIKLVPISGQGIFAEGMKKLAENQRNAVNFLEINNKFRDRITNFVEMLYHEGIHIDVKTETELSDDGRTVEVVNKVILSPEEAYKNNFLNLMRKMRAPVRMERKNDPVHVDLHVECEGWWSHPCHDDAKSNYGVMLPEDVSIPVPIFNHLALLGRDFESWPGTAAVVLDYLDKDDKVVLSQEWDRYTAFLYGMGGLTLYPDRDYTFSKTFTIADVNKIANVKVRIIPPPLGRTSYKKYRMADDNYYNTYDDNTWSWLIREYWKRIKVVLPDAA